MSERVVLRTVVGSDGQLTIPPEIRRLSGLADGDLVELEIVEGRIMVTRLGPIDAEDAWFWTEEWQAKEREVEADIAAGRLGTFYPDDESFLRSLEPPR